VRSYGQYVGDKFRSLPNIIWVLGGDFTPPGDSLWTVDAVAEGIREKDPNHLMTGHPARGHPQPALSEARVAGRKCYLQLRSETLCSAARRLRKAPLRPFVLLESVYENEHESHRTDPPTSILGNAEWSLRQFLGNCPIWHFDGPALQAEDDLEKALVTRAPRTWSD